jgi:ubiquinone/menaquinone biosynthesis C-methylase UbiE
LGNFEIIATRALGAAVPLVERSDLPLGREDSLGERRTNAHIRGGSDGSQMPANARRYQRIAPFYDLLELPFEYGRYRRLRRLVFNGLAGRILDAGVGTGRNTEFYPQGAEVVGIDISPAMLARAARRIRKISATIELREMDVTRLDFPAGSFDIAVATFLFCVLPDDLQLPALRELRRVVRGGGTIRLLDYVRPQRPLRRAIAGLWEPWIARAYGASFDRRTEKYVREAGLELVAAEFVVDDLVKLLTAQVPG